MPSRLLSDAEVAAIAAAFGLGDVFAWQPIAAGTINSNFSLTCARGRFFIRINEGKSAADVAYEMALLEALADRGVPLVRALTTADGASFLAHGDHLVSAFPWAEGSHRERHEVTADDAAQVGGALASLHRAGAEILADFERPGIYTFADLVRRFDGFRQSPDPALAPAIAAIGDEIHWQQARFSATEDVARSVIHGDLFRDNVLFVGPSLAALIDFEQASAGACAYDLAVCINAWCYDHAFDPALIAALVAGYQKVRPLGGDKDALYILTRRAAMRFAITRVTDVYLAKATSADKDFARYVARLEALREAGRHEFDAWLGG